MIPKTLASVTLLALSLLAFAVPAMAAWVDQDVSLLSGAGRGTDMVVDSSGTLHAAFYVSSLGHLYYGTNSGSGWVCGPAYEVADAGQFPSLVLDAAELPIISFWDVTNLRLLMVRKNPGGTWDAEIVDDPPGSWNVGYDSTIKIASDGTLYVAYYDVAAQNLRFATKLVDGSWDIDTIDSAGVVGRHATMVLSEVGAPFFVHIPQIFYHDETNGDLKSILRNTQGEWTTQIIDDGPPGARRGLYCDAQILPGSSGRIYVSYQDFDARELKMASYLGGSWSTQVVDTGNVGAGTSMDYPRIAYYDVDTTRIKVAFLSSAGWFRQFPDEVLGTGGWPAIATLPEGQPVILFHDWTTTSLREVRLVDLDTPVVNILSPAGAELWVPGSEETIRWTATDSNPIASIQVDILRQGEPPQIIASGLADVDSFNWTVTEPTSPSSQVRVSAMDIADQTGSGTNSVPFVIAYGTPLYNAATLEWYYEGELLVSWLDIRQQLLLDNQAHLYDTYYPQITTDPLSQLMYVLGDKAAWNSPLHVVDFAAGGLITTVILDAPLGARGLAWDPVTDDLYTVLNSVSGDADQLARVDPSSGACEVLGTIVFVPPSGTTMDMIAVAPNGTLYGVSDVEGTEALWTVDLEDQTATLVGQLDAGFEPDDLGFVGSELWIERGPGYFERLSTVDASTLESYSVGSEAVAQRPCGQRSPDLMVSDAPADGGGQIRVEWGSYTAPGGSTAFEIFCSTDPCRLDDPTLPPLLSVPIGNLSATIPCGTDYTSVYVALRAVDNNKRATLETLYAGPVWSLPNLIINEFAPAGGVPKAGDSKRVGEKVEIRNLSTDPLDITGFRLSNGAGPPTPDEETLSGIVSGGGLFVHTLQSIDLPDTGGTILLLPPEGSSVSLDIVSYGSQGGAPTVPAGFTVSRVEGTNQDDPDQSSFEASEQSFGVTNKVPEPDLGGSVVLNEVLYTSTSGDDYIEIHNPQSSLVNLGEIALSDGVGFLETLSEGLVLGPGERTVLRQTDPGSILPDLTSSMLYLYKLTSDGQYQRIDQLGWEGGPAPGTAPDDALMRIPDGTTVYLGDAGTNWWDCGGGDALLYGTRSPGEPNTPPGAVVVLVDPSGVPPSYPTIEAALAAESPPVTILVAPGIYDEAVSFENGVQLIGAGANPQDVVLTGGGVSRVVDLLLGPLPEPAVVSNLTVRAIASRAFGTGISVAPGCRATIRNVHFERNHATVGGAGLNIRGADSEVIGCLFVANTSDGDGAALRTNPGTGTVWIRDSVFVLNRAHGNGSALSVASGSAVVEHCVFDRNEAYDAAGGIVHARGEVVEISHSIVSNNLNGRHLSTRGGTMSTSIDFHCGVLDGALLNLETSVGEGTIDTSLVSLEDPAFCQPLALNYSLQESSPLLSDMESCGDLIGLSGPPCNYVTDAEPAQIPPRTTQLQMPYPNPFNPRTTIQLEMAQPGRVDLLVYDARGRRVRALLSGVRLEAGAHPILWEGNDAQGRSVASGVYFLQLMVDGQATGETRRAVLLR